jgi:hypothetical protein
VHQLGDAFLGVDVHPRERHLVAREELADQERLARGARADHPRRAIAALDEVLAPCDERAQQHLADVGLLADDPSDVGRADAQHLGRLAGDGADDGPAPGEQVDVAGELPAPVDLDHARLFARAVDDLHLAGEDDVEPAPPVAGAEERLAGCEAALLTVPLQGLDLSGGKGGVDGRGAFLAHVTAGVDEKGPGDARVFTRSRDRAEAFR